MRLNIAFTGKIAAGKTSAAVYLAEKYGLIRASIAAPLKEIATVHSEYEPELWQDVLRSKVAKLVPDPKKRPILCEMILELFESLPPVRPPQKPRELMQKLGTEVGRKFDEDLWIDYFIRVWGNQDKLVVDDVRFENEVLKLKQAGFVIVRLDVSRDVQKQRMQRLYGKVDESVFSHPSETALDGKEHLFDYRINADLPLEEMCRSIEAALRQVLPRTRDRTV